MRKGRFREEQNVMAYAALVEDWLRQLRLHRLESFFLKTSEKIVRIKRNLGVSLDGALRDFEYRDGKGLNVMVMSVLEPEWEEIPDRYRLEPAGGS